MPQAVDYSFSRPAPADLVADGYVGALRYLCSLPNAKAITGDEVASLHANGLAVALVFEDGAANALAGTAQGMIDGHKARRQADDLGLPMDRPIYAAVDTDAQTFQFDSIEAYLRAFGTETGRPVGVYGSWFVIEAMLDRGAATFAWQTAAWSHGHRSARAQLYQRVGGAPPGCDVNDVLADDWGQWPAPTQDPTPSPQPTEDTVRFHYAKPDNSPNVYLVSLAAPPRHVKLFRDAEYWATEEGHVIVEIGDHDLGGDENGDVRKGSILDAKGRELFGLPA